MMAADRGEAARRAEGLGTQAFMRLYICMRAAIAGHVARGVTEINLISQHTASYGVDLRDGTDLEGSLRAVDRVHGRCWAR